MKLIHFGIVIVSFLMIFTTGFAFGDQPVGQRTIAKGEGEWCMSQEPTSWIKERLGESGCVKVGYTVPPECNKWSNEWRSEKGMSDCQPPPAPTASPVPTPVPVPAPAPAPPTVYDFTEPTPAPVPMQSAQEDDYTIPIAAISMIIIVGIIIGLMKRKKNSTHVKEKNIHKSAEPTYTIAKPLDASLEQGINTSWGEMKIKDVIKTDQDISEDERKLRSRKEIEDWLHRNYKTGQSASVLASNLERDKSMSVHISLITYWVNLVQEHVRVEEIKKRARDRREN